MGWLFWRKRVEDEFSSKEREQLDAFEHQRKRFLALRHHVRHRVMYSPWKNEICKALLLIIDLCEHMKGLVLQMHEFSETRDVKGARQMRDDIHRDAASIRAFINQPQNRFITKEMNLLAERLFRDTSLVDIDIDRISDLVHDLLEDMEGTMR